MAKKKNNPSDREAAVQAKAKKDLDKLLLASEASVDKEEASETKDDADDADDDEEAQK